MNLPEDIKIFNFNKFKKFLEKLFGQETTCQLLNNLGTQDDIINATFAIKNDNGLAYNGSLLNTIFELADYADKLNELLPDNVKIDKSKIYKVCLLQHIGKIKMYEPNDNSWEVEKRGLLYKFSNSNNTLKLGEISSLIALNSGIKLSEDEFESIRVLDKIKENDDSIKYFLSPLSTIIKQANELIYLIHKK